MVPELGDRDWTADGVRIMLRRRSQEAGLRKRQAPHVPAHPRQRLLGAGGNEPTLCASQPAVAADGGAISDAIYRRLVHEAQAAQEGPARARGDDYKQQRDRLNPYRRLFGEATSPIPRYPRRSKGVLTQSGAILFWWNRGDPADI